MGEADNEPQVDRIRRVHKYDRDGARLGLHCLHARRAQCNDEVWPQSNQLGRLCANGGRIARAPAIVDLEVIAFFPSPRPQALTKRRYVRQPLRIVFWDAHQCADQSRTL